MAMSQNVNGYINLNTSLIRVDQYKAHFVVNGLNQTHGIDFFETCSLVIKSSTIQIVLTATFSS